jgi:hypothetical protein
MPKIGLQDKALLTTVQRSDFIALFAMFHAPRVMSFLKLVACCLVSLVLFLAVVIVASSDDENPRGDAFAGTLIFFMVATVSYRYWKGLDWGGPPRRVDAENPGCDLGNS